MAYSESDETGARRSICISPPLEDRRPKGVWRVSLALGLIAKLMVVCAQHLDLDVLSEGSLRNGGQTWEREGARWDFGSHF